MLTFEAILASAGLRPGEVLTIRHAYRYKDGHPDGTPGIHADSSDEEVLSYTRRQGAFRGPGSFSADPPAYWAVFVQDGGNRARLWSVVINKGLVCFNPSHRWFDLSHTDLLADLRDRLVIDWRAPRAWWTYGTTSANYPVLEIVNAKPVPFPGFDALTLDYPKLQALVHEHRYAGWRTALASVKGIYLITDTSTGRHYVGKADGAENLLQRWASYASSGHGGNVGLQGLDSQGFRWSVLRVFDPTTPTDIVDRAESHFKHALDSRKHGLNEN